jgi:hypothetical protein
MNVTIKIEDQIGKDARHMAVDSGMSLSGWVAELIRREILRAKSAKPKSLLQVLGDERFLDAELDLTRDKSPMREVDLS